MKYDPSVRIEEDPEVYPPSDDSIMLIQSFNVEPDEKVLELGCGSGVVGIHCAREGADVTCGDINPRAVELTRANAKVNSVRIKVLETDVFSNVEGKFDTIVFNLPYLPVQEEGELARAWSGGEDGLGPLPELIKGAPNHLEESGRIVVVVSTLMDRDKLDALLADHSVSVISELSLFFEKLKVLEIRISR